MVTDGGFDFRVFSHTEILTLSAHEMGRQRAKHAYHASCLPPFDSGVCGAEALLFFLHYKLVPL